MFRHAAATVPHRPAVVLGDRQLTFGEVDRAANRLARALRHAGLAVGDVVVAWSATELDLVPLFAAAAKAGAVFAPLHPALGRDEALELLAVCRPSLVVADEGRFELAGELAAGLGAACERLDQLVRSSAAEPADDYAAAALDERDAHLVSFTSGSTGQPKGAVLSHRVSYLRSHPGSLPEPRGPMLCPWPLFQPTAWSIALQQWQARDPLVLVEATDPAGLCRAVVEHRATRLRAEPALWRRLIAHLEALDDAGAAPPDLSPLELADTDATAAPPALLEAVRRALPAAGLRVVYGSTEAGIVACLDDADLQRKPGRCGLPAVGTELRVEPDGELLVRGPLVFDGYLGDEVATAAAFRDGWYRTGDLGEIDRDGYLTITGRRRDVIVTGDESVAPVEVETALASHRRVDDVAVVGWPDVRYGEIVCAVVVPAPGGPPPSLDELQAHCTARIDAFKQPRRLVIVDELPRTATTHEVERRLLLELLA